MKILLISASIEVESREPTIQTNSHYPIGLSYIHSYLERSGHTVKLLFLNDYSYEACNENIIESLNAFAPDVVGFQIITHNRVNTFQNIEHVHKHFPDIKIVIGGIHTTLMYEQILSRFKYVTAVLGEGEVTFNELVSAFENNGNLENIDGIAFYDIKHDKILKTKGRDLIHDLDSLPFPKHENYFSGDRKMACLLTSRGCPCACSFCVLDSISRRKVRFRSVENIILEIEHLVASFKKLDTVWIHDDSFLLDNNRAIDLCNEIVKRKIKLKFICSARFKPISKELVKALERAGFELVLFGLESGSSKILESSHKGITKEDVEKTYQLFAASPIGVVCFVIVGLYGENDDTILETVHFIQKLQKIKYTFFDDIGVLAIYPGTEIFEIAKNNGLITDDYWMTDNAVPLFTLEHTPDQLMEYKERIRDYISVKKFRTKSGFKAQLPMIPYLLRWRVSKKVKKVRRIIKKLSGFLSSVFGRFCNTENCHN